MKTLNLYADASSQNSGEAPFRVALAVANEDGEQVAYSVRTCWNTVHGELLAIQLAVGHAMIWDCQTVIHSDNSGAVGRIKRAKPPLFSYVEEREPAALAFSIAEALGDKISVIWIPRAQNLAHIYASRLRRKAKA